MEAKVYRLRAFPKERHGGNAAGVVVDANKLSEKEMQEIAKKVGFSETAFVIDSSNADFKVRFFTPLSEVGLCGHATIATFNLLRDLGRIKKGFFTQETKVGILKLEVKRDTVFMEQVPPIYGEFVDSLEICECFYNTDFIDNSLPIRVLSTGMKEIFLPVKSVEKLNNLEPNFHKIIELSHKYNVIGIHCFSLTDEEGVDAYGRNFAPIVGIDEESATGTSNGALGCYLNNYVNEDKTKYILRQGYNMNKPSEIVTLLHIKNDEVVTVFVGGSATIFRE